MNNLRLKNYRCFTDTGDIDLRPITMLIGANSTGKSSLLKFFPLLKQTVGEFNTGLFLWTGSLVDLKDFKNTVREGENDMTVEFTIKNLPVRSRTREKLEYLTNVRVELVLSSKQDEEHYDFIKRMNISFDKHSFILEINDDGIKSLNVDNLNSLDLKEDIILGSTNSLLPKIGFQIAEDEISDESSVAYKRMRSLMSTENKILFLRTLIRTNDNVFDDERLRNQILNKGKQLIDEKNVDRFINYLHYFTVNRLIDSINIYLIHLAERITYVKPLRAIVERYYRYTNLSVNEISADGSNLPMFYNSLSKETKQKLNSWLYKLFGFKIKLGALEGHLELLIEEKNKSIRNLVDVGFGYTQILPILTILWKKLYMDCINKPSNVCRTFIVAIEQPELHLHPRFQGLFANMLSAVVNDAKKLKINIRIVIESHSEVIINRLGELIADENNPLRAEDVNILIFNSPQDNLEREVTTAEFDDTGMLNNWPYGFFSDYVYRD